MASLLKLVNLVAYRPGAMPPPFGGSTLDGRPLALTDLRGKVVILNFWASWCLECRAEMPRLESLHRSYPSRGLAIVGVNAREDARAGGERACPCALRGAAGRAGLTSRRTMTRLGRREVLAGILLTMGARGSRDLGAQPARLVKIGALTESWGPSTTIVGLRDGLRERGYRENTDFVIGVRFTQGSLSELPQAARDLVAHGVDVIVAGGEGQAPKAAQMATSQIPIVFVGASDPVAAGLVKSIARPAGNLTGIADLDVELVPKRMEIFRELVPRLRRILLVYDATNAEAIRRLGVHRDAARRLGLTLVERPVRTEDEARAVIGGAQKSEVDGFFDPRLLTLNIPGLLMELALQRGMPTMFYDSFFVDRTGLASYGANSYELGRQAARLVEKILKGAKPADLPVEQPTKFGLVLNLRTAKALGLTIPQSLLLRADRVIQ